MQSRNRTGFAQREVIGLIFFAQVHAAVQGGDLVRITVEHQGLSLEELTDTAFLALAPARVVHLGVDVGIKPVFLGRRHVPGRPGLFASELYPDDGLDALEPVFPGHYQAYRGAVLVRQHFAVQADGQQGQGMHGFVDAQPLAIRPVQDIAPHPGHLLGTHDGGEGHVFRIRGGLEPLQHVGQRDTHPGDDHGPGFDAAQPVDALLQLVRPDDVLVAVGAGFHAFAVNDHGPGLRFEFPGVFRRVALVRAELVEVVVAGDGVIRRQLLVRGVLVVPESWTVLCRPARR